MKARINITIEESILDKAKIFAAKKHLSLSQMIEDYLNNIIKPAKRKNIIDLVDKLKAPTSIPADMDLKEAYYEERKSKYGF